MGDPVRLRQVLLNLLNNAVKFTAHGGVTLGASSTGPDRLRFDVSDTGIGIAPDQLPNIFRDFQQVDASTTRRFGGTGLGLSISRRLVEAMGGSLNVESRPGIGSHFYFEAVLPEAVKEVRSPAPAKPPAPLPSGLRVLIAEDNPINQTVIARMLAGLAAQIEFAENGARAVEMCASSPFDVILMDCQMPELDGYQATEQIRALSQRCANTPILGVTASAFGESRERCEAAGMDGSIVKPLRRDSLLDAISGVLAGRKG